MTSSETNLAEISDLLRSQYAVELPLVLRRNPKNVRDFYRLVEAVVDTGIKSPRGLASGLGLEVWEVRWLMKFPEFVSFCEEAKRQNRMLVGAIKSQAAVKTAEKLDDLVESANEIADVARIDERVDAGARQDADTTATTAETMMGRAILAGIKAMMDDGSGEKGKKADRPELPGEGRVVSTTGI